MTLKPESVTIKYPVRLTRIRLPLMMAGLMPRMGMPMDGIIIIRGTFHSRTEWGNTLESFLKIGTAEIPVDVNMLQKLPGQQPNVQITVRGFDGMAEGYLLEPDAKETA